MKTKSIIPALAVACACNTASIQDAPNQDQSQPSGPYGFEAGDTLPDICLDVQTVQICLWDYYADSLADTLMIAFVGVNDGPSRRLAAAQSDILTALAEHGKATEPILILEPPGDVWDGLAWHEEHSLQGPVLVDTAGDWGRMWTKPTSNCDRTYPGVFFVDLPSFKITAYAQGFYDSSETAESFLTSAGLF
jgi:hypothetical protein